MDVINLNRLKYRSAYNLAKIELFLSDILYQSLSDLDNLKYINLLNKSCFDKGNMSSRHKFTFPLVLKSVYIFHTIYS